MIKTIINQHNPYSINRSILLFLIVFFSFTSNAQLLIDKTEHNFGDINASTSRTIDFHIVNQYKFSIILFNFNFDLSYSSAYNNISIAPNDTLHYRVKIMPKKKGLYHKIIPVYFSEITDTIYLELYANILTLDFENSGIVKPFAEKPRKNEEAFHNFPTHFRILDVETKQPIKNATVNFSSKNVPYRTLKTDENGEATRILHNRYTVSVYATGYQSVSFGISLGCQDSIRTVLLPKFDPDKKTEFDYFYEYEAKNPILAQEDVVVLTPAEEEELLTPLKEGKFKPNNIVFLMDVSYSMNDHNRLELLKSALIQFIELTRPEDNISIITFSKETTIAVAPTYLNQTNRATIINRIKNFSPEGMTNGGNGLKMAFKLVKENFTLDKNNQIILATDGALGAFMKHEDIVSFVDKNYMYARTSVVTINGYTWSGKFMHEIANAGNGKLFTINNEKEAKYNLIKEIKANSVME